jgi:hypothetical protein
MRRGKHDVTVDRQSADLWSVINGSKTYQQFQTKWLRAKSAEPSRVVHQSNHAAPWQFGAVLRSDQFDFQGITRFSSS